MHVDARVTSLDTPGKPEAATTTQRGPIGRRIQPERRSATASGSRSRGDRQY
jgi:hypothetical protein